MTSPAIMGMAIALLWVAAAGLASRLPPPGEMGADDEAASTDAVSRLFGSGREVISQHLYTEADRYFHQGVGHVHERAFQDHPYLRWAQAITPGEHVELEGESIAEIMPWLRMATKADPRNIQAYTTAAFWLGTQNDVEAANKVLEEARRMNPGDYRVSLALGQLFYHHGLLDRALVELDQARDEWPSGQDTADRQTRLDLAAVLSLGAGVHERKGHRDETMDRFRQILALFPGRDAVRERLRRLERGETAGDAEHFWEDQLSTISSAGGGRHVAGGGHRHDEDCDHDP
jgi:tetratricopeptide (TPR) repeat protein